MNNYSKYRLSLYSILLLIVIGTGCSKTKKEKTEKIETPPNIILFLVDDMGWQDTSLPFWKEETPLNRRFNTPAMERLAEDGMMFTQAYASPICSPTRVSLMS